ncbi:hypothetical protein V8G54_034059 [Vigna mungo]|uniref:carnosine N-methyltransferase n=1 Tax=Vigna mungo TaxID=3915 RepID=A0AAQ3MQ33_VIGMU
MDSRTRRVGRETAIIIISAWDAVVTCFFIDTAHNIVEYIEIISKILKDGGVWINLGPLLYHFADVYGQEDEMSIELSLEDVKSVAVSYGFEFEKESTIETTYTTNPRSMMQVELVTMVRDRITDPPFHGVEELKQQAMATQHRAEAAMKALEELRKQNKEL